MGEYSGLLRAVECWSIPVCVGVFPDVYWLAEELIYLQQFSQVGESPKVNMSPAFLFSWRWSQLFLWGQAWRRRTCKVCQCESEDATGYLDDYPFRIKFPVCLDEMHGQTCYSSLSLIAITCDFNWTYYFKYLFVSSNSNHRVIHHWEFWSFWSSLPIKNPKFHPWDLPVF